MSEGVVTGAPRYAVLLVSPLAEGEVDQQGPVVGEGDALWEAISTALRAWLARHSADLLALPVETARRLRLEVYTQDELVGAASIHAVRVPQEGACAGIRLLISDVALTHLETLERRAKIDAILEIYRAASRRSAAVEHEDEGGALDAISRRAPIRLDDAAHRMDMIRFHGISAQEARAHRQQVALGYGGYWCVALPSDPIHAVFARHAQEGAEALERALRQYGRDTGKPVIGLEPNTHTGDTR